MGIKASIIIPTKNGQQYLEEVLNMVFRQKAVFANEESKEGGGLPFAFEVICVDSGSKDKTLEILKKFPQIKLYQIPPQEFGHGKTRNFAASKAQGEYFVFLTQDAIPADENWLKNIIKPMEDDSEVAGVFGRHLPQKECDLFQRKTLNLFMESFGKEITVYQLIKPDSELTIPERHFLTACFSI